MHSILIVDDDVSELDTLSEVLEYGGAALLGSGSVRSASLPGGPPMIAAIVATVGPECPWCGALLWLVGERKQCWRCGWEQAA